MSDSQAALTVEACAVLSTDPGRSEEAQGLAASSAWEHLWRKPNGWANLLLAGRPQDPSSPGVLEHLGGIQGI